MMQAARAAQAPQRALPKGPVFGWDSLRRYQVARPPSVAALRHVAYTTSGRAAIYQALLQMDLPAGSGVLVPRYHCPTMIAPIKLAGHLPVFFEIRADGLPELASIEPVDAARCGAIVVPQYFGLAKSLHEVRAWCDAQGIRMIEDCAHCFYGQAGDRPVGAWGDYCTASLSKFFPVPEAGLLASAHHALRPLDLQTQRLRNQAKGLVDVVELATYFKRLPGLDPILRGLFSLKGGARRTGASPSQTPPPATPADIEANCDMGRIEMHPLWISRLLPQIISQSRIVAKRSRHYAQYGELCSDLPGCRALSPLASPASAPYVFPLWVDDAERVYHGLRALQVPVFRWDQVWPAAQTAQPTRSSEWSRHVLQFLCHQDLSEDDIRYCVRSLQGLLIASPTDNHRAATPSTESKTC